MNLREYEVLYVERAENTAYICRKPPEGRLYRVIESDDRARIAKYIKYFSKHAPDSFYEDFCLNEKYYAVFDNPDGIPAEDAELSARKVVRALALQNPPPGIAVKILSKNYIFVCGEELEFAYELPETDMEITQEIFFERLADFVSSLWGTRGDPRAEKWIADLRAGSFENLLTAYRCMPDFAEKASSRNRERLEKIKDILLKIAAAAAAAAAIAAGILALCQGGGDEEYDSIASLGTIDLIGAFAESAAES